MDSITQLQSKLREAENILRYVSKELENFAEDKSVGSKLNFAEIKLRGEQYAFYEHPLKKQIFQDEYFALMIYVISLGGKKEEGWTTLYQIVAGCDYKKDLQHLTTDAMTLTEERLSEIIRMIYSAEMARTFALDSLLICCHMGADDAQLKFLSNFYDLLKLDKNFLTEAIQFVKAFDATFWDNPADKSKPWKFLVAKDIATYIGGTPAASLEEAANLKKNRVIVLNATYTGSSVLSLDDWQPNEILFLNCRFENCAGIYSNNKVVKFLSCSFDQSNFKLRKFDPYYSSQRDYFLSQYKWTTRDSRIPYSFENASFANCTFKHFNDATHFLYLGSGLIHGCTFEDIRQYPTCCVMFIINNACVSNCLFKDCYNSPHNFNGIFDINNRGEKYITCMILSANTLWKDNKFVNCSNCFNLDSYDYKLYSYVLLLDKGSRCNDCSFDNVTTIIKRHRSGYRSDYWEDCAETSVIGLHDSSESNNEGATVSNVDTINLLRSTF